MKGEGGDLSENLVRDEPERRRRSASGRQHQRERVEVAARVVGERARRHHALEVCVAVRRGRKRGTGGEQDRIDTSYLYVIIYYLARLPRRARVAADLHYNSWRPCELTPTDPNRRRFRSRLTVSPPCCSKQSQDKIKLSWTNAGGRPRSAQQKPTKSRAQFPR